jgi:3',5'-cyclic AMP phosphodiesterase CpdA
MKKEMERREFLKLMGLGSAVLVSGVAPFAHAATEKTAPDDFLFLQLSDTHWGFDNPMINPDFGGTLKKAVATVNGLTTKPDFIMFTGDLTHTTDDAEERLRRLKEFRSIVAELKVKKVHFMPGEHDASLDNGIAFQKIFGATHYTFAHKGVNFIVIDNVSDPGGSIGVAQLKWLAYELEKLEKDARIVVFTHRPLFDLAPTWDWFTRDGGKAVDLLMPYRNVVVFYGHIHQVNHFMTGHIPHHSAQGLMYPLPAPLSQPKKAPIPWDPAEPYKNLGYRGIVSKPMLANALITDYPVKR